MPSSSRAGRRSSSSSSAWMRQAWPRGCTGRWATPSRCPSPRPNPAVRREGMAKTSPDPVAEGRAYQQLLLGLLGEDDPAEVQQVTEAALRSVLRDAGSALRGRPAPAEWSVVELLGHLVDAEI